MFSFREAIPTITMVDDFSPIASGQGSYWEDQGYEWHAGIQRNRLACVQAGVTGTTPIDGGRSLGTGTIKIWLFGGQRIKP